MNFNYGAVIKVNRKENLKYIKANLIQMKEHGLNTAVIWPAAFYWEEKSEDYPYRTGKEILEIAEHLDMKIIMELAGQHTSLENIPDSETKKEYYPVDKNGNMEWGQTSFGFFNYFHPEVKEKLAQSYRSIANAYKDCKALIGYDIFNETMFRSFDEYTMEEFRTYLKEKYQTLEKLNDVWDRTYSDWSQVNYTEWTWLSGMPYIDYRRFRKDAIKRFLMPLKNAIKEVDNKHTIIVDNIHSMMMKGDYDRPQDDFSIAEVADEIGMSFYPNGVKNHFDYAQRNMIFDAYYCAAGHKPYWISEMQAGGQAMFNPTSKISAKELETFTFEAISSGAKGIIHWMFRPFTTGLQTSERGLVDVKGRASDRLLKIKELAPVIEKLENFETVKAQCAVVYDDLTHDFQKMFTHSYDVDRDIYLNSLANLYKAFLDSNVKVDIIKARDLKESDYRVVISTMQICIDKDTEKIYKNYVENGGTLILDGRFGFVDEYGQLRTHLPCGELGNDMGLDLRETDTGNMNFGEFKGGYERMIYELSDAKILKAYKDGIPALISKEFGKGKFITFSSYVWYNNEKAKDIADYLINTLSLRTFKTKGNVLFKVCEKSGDKIVFIFNYSNEPQKCSIDFIRKYNAYNVVTGKKANLKKLLAEPGVTIIRTE